MSVVGNNLGQSFLATAKPIANGARSSSKAGAKDSSASSSSSTDFAKIFNDKESNSRKESLSKQGREKIETFVNSSDAKDKQPPKRVDERAELPRSPGKDLASNLPGRLDGRDINQKVANKLANQGSSSVQSKIENRESDESVDDLVDRQALQQLLKRMKDEFGLDAEEIVGAFATLSADELQQPPEATLDKVIQALPLSPEQQVQAKAIFQDMLKQTAADGMADYLTASNRQLSLEVVSKNEAQKRATSLAVDQMQNSFFGEAVPKAAVHTQTGISKYKNQKSEAQNGEAGVLGMIGAAAGTGATIVGTAATSASSAQAPISGAAVPKTFFAPDGQLISEESGSTDWQKLGMQQITEDQGAPTPIAPAGLKANEAAVAAPAYQPMAPASSLSEQQQATMLKNLINDQAGTPGKAAAQVTPQTAVAAPGVTNVTTAPSAPNMSLAAFGLANGDQAAMSSEGDEEAAADGQDLQNLGASHLQKTPLEAKNTTPESFVIQTKPTENQEANNIRNVVHEAQILARKGGGEMKMILSPEGLGQLTMKVNVENGKVNVEMVADSNEAKKIIEKGLGELKATLISHNLKVDQIRIDTPSDVSKHMDSQQGDAQRNNAQQFMEQFRQDNSEWRRGFFDIGGAKRYGSQKDAIENAIIAKPDNSRRTAGSRRLDLVA